MKETTCEACHLDDEREWKVLTRVKDYNRLFYEPKPTTNVEPYEPLHTSKSGWRVINLRGGK